MKKLIMSAVIACGAVGAQAAELDAIDKLTVQKDFRALSEDLGAALSYKALVPAEAMGITGFDVGVEVTATTLANSDVYKTVTGSGAATLPVPKLHVHKGLPFGIDVGAFYASVPTSNIKLVGGELRYALIDGGVAMPAVGVRATMSNLSGVDQLDLNTKGLELTVSKGFVLLTPYAGVGQVWVDSKANLPTTAASLKDESFTLPKAFVGANLSLGLINFLVEADKTGDATTYGAKLSVGF